MIIFWDSKCIMVLSIVESIQINGSNRVNIILIVIRVGNLNFFEPIKPYHHFLRKDMFSLMIIRRIKWLIKLKTWVIGYIPNSNHKQNFLLRF